MIADPMPEIEVLLILVAGYEVLGTVVWLVFCGGNTSAVRKLNAAVEAREGPVFSFHSAIERRATGTACGAVPDLDATLIALVAEKRLSSAMARRLRRIRPAFHEGKWTVYPSNAYWAHRFERLNSR